MLLSLSLTYQHFPPFCHCCHAKARQKMGTTEILRQSCCPDDISVNGEYRKTVVQILQHQFLLSMQIRQAGTPHTVHIQQEERFLNSQPPTIATTLLWLDHLSLLFAIQISSEEICSHRIRIVYGLCGRCMQHRVASNVVEWFCR